MSKNVSCNLSWAAHLFWSAFALSIALFVPFQSQGQVTQLKPRILLIFDTSGSMAYDMDGNTGTYGDGSWDPWGTRYCCPGKGNSRLYYAKEAVRQMIFATGDIDFALMKFPQYYTADDADSYPDSNQYRYNQSTTDRDKTRYKGDCSYVDYGNANDYRWLCVEFPSAATLVDNRGAIMMWMDHHEFHPDGSGEPDFAPVAEWSRYDSYEQELRADGYTPLAGSMLAAEKYLEAVYNIDHSGTTEDEADAECRPYSVILLTDGVEYCGGDPDAAAQSLHWLEDDNVTGDFPNKEVNVWVVGFAVNTDTLNALNQIATNGGTEYARSAQSQEQLSAVLYDIIADSMLQEVCNQEDDDCDGEIDEDFRPHATYCNTGCDSYPHNGYAREDADILCSDPTECECDGVDNNCDGETDEGNWPPDPNSCGGCDASQPGQSYCADNPDGANEGRCVQGDSVCVPGTGYVCIGSIDPTQETCNGLDDDCDGDIDEDLVGDTCGACEDGTWICSGGQTKCCGPGSSATVCTDLASPGVEICNGADDDCDGEVDENLTRACGGCDATVPVWEYCADNVNGANEGTCFQGTETCTAAQWGDCTGDWGPQEEICNLLDDDCDGQTDEGPDGDPLMGDTCGTCQDGNWYCLSGGEQCCAGLGADNECLALQDPLPETCNNIDDDCDGDTDEDVAPQECMDPAHADQDGIGICHHGYQTCVAGEWGAGTPWVEEACDNQQLPDPPEKCNNLDDDCDGFTDEEIAPTGTCGECNDGQLYCVEGTLQCCAGIDTNGDCIAVRISTSEICNNIDDDCDGSVDEDILPRECMDAAHAAKDGVGICHHGYETCVAGSWGAVNPVNDTWEANYCANQQLPTEEICNLADDDCDGLMDEQDDAGNPIVGEVCGPCDDGQEVCTDGAMQCQGASIPDQETCNNIDDDCDGFTDENLSRECMDEEHADKDGIGICHHGIQSCKAGQWGFGETDDTWVAEVCGNQQLPELEVCDCLDNDCNGVDDDNIGSPVGDECSACGVWVCQDCDIQCNGLATPETCDGVDENCNGATDENLYLECGGCGLEETAPAYEDCIAAQIADMNIGPDEGECQVGVRWCEYDGTDDNPDEYGLCQGSVGPAGEICDDKDNDCDGVTDEPAEIEQVGEQCATAVGICEDGWWQCVDDSDGVKGLMCCASLDDEGGCVPPQGPGIEVCNGIDDDCNGSVDDNLLGVGEACGNDLGICQSGRYECVCDDPLTENCDIICVGATLGTAELCNNLDDDCDGLTDEDIPLGEACNNMPDGMPPVGECDSGFLECVDGEFKCNAPGPMGEVCDGLDNDCDGQTDEGLAVECPNGSICMEGACTMPCVGQEMSCPAGYACANTETEQGLEIRICVTDVCREGSENALPCVTNNNWCDEGHSPPCKCSLAQRRCVGLCEGVNCPEGKVCVEGKGTCHFIADDCYAKGCSDGEICTNGTCVTDPCLNMDCADGEYCDPDGKCVKPCLEDTCPSMCVKGQCVDLCESVACTPGKQCNPTTGNCIDVNACDEVNCRFYEVCEDGACLTDPCWDVTCPNGLECRGGSCYAYEEREIVFNSEVDTGVSDTDNVVDTNDTDVSADDTDTTPASFGMTDVLATGTGGCLCSTTVGVTNRTGSSMGWVLIMGFLVLIRVFIRRPKLGMIPVKNVTKNRAKALFSLLIFALVSPMLFSCDSNPYHFDSKSYSQISSDLGESVGDNGTTSKDKDVIDAGSSDSDSASEGCDTTSMDDNCDGVDDNCNGLTDEGVDLQNNAYHCGACLNDCSDDFENAFGACENGVCVQGDCMAFYLDANQNAADGCEAYCKATAETDKCNGIDLGDGLYVGLDDNCNGQIDEDVDLQSDPLNCSACGNVCRFPHAKAICVSGQCDFEQCDEGFYNYDGDKANGCEYRCSDPAETETCNNRDDDCDGMTDEDNPGGGLPCYTAESGCTADGDTFVCAGQCQAGTTQCTNAGLVCNNQVTPLPLETCNNLDDNCDGRTDENLHQACATEEYQEIGECHQGLQTCVNGEFGICTAEVIPSVEICDGKDNDCDGETDEEIVYTEPCGGATPPNDANEGNCHTGTLACVNGEEVCTGDQSPTPELWCTDVDDSCCDNIDNDCDGHTDDNITVICGGCDPSVYDYCTDRNEGQCQSGISSCVGGALGTCIASILPSEEVCDGLDNDCDGVTDEGEGDVPITGESCSACGGIEHCIEGKMTCCAGIDDNGCIAPKVPSVEICNNEDDNCDGSIDEGLQQSCMDAEHADKDGIGICHSGVQTCRDGVWGYGDSDDTWVAGVCGNQQIPLPQELCNNQDDDCDGSIDEDISARDCGQYSLGACQTGTQTCSAGQWGSGSPWVKDSCGGQVLPTIETCNNIDDDCDGTTDNNLTDVGTACDGDDSDACMEGVWTCDNGTLTCTDTTEDSVEICDGLDNDCQNGIDDGLESRPEGVCNDDCGAAYVSATCNGASGWQCNYACASGASHPEGEVQCDVNNQVVNSETWCNGIDDDCDGDIDENLTSNIDNCGSCGIACWSMVPNDANVASVSCVGSQCRINECDDDHWDLDGNPDGELDCEYGPCEFEGAEGSSCDYADNDCDGQTDNGPAIDEVCDGIDNDCDQEIDEAEDLAGTEPDICNPLCPGTGHQARCYGADNWKCDYDCRDETGDVDCVDDNTIAAAETTCDGIDNNCSGTADEGFQLWGGDAVIGARCNNGKDGECYQEGWVKCSADETELVCCTEETGTNCGALSGDTVVLDPPTFPEGNTADGLDNDCDGYVDDGATGCVATVNISGLDSGGGTDDFAMFKYEASRYNATGDNDGDTVPCSQAGVSPWTRISFNEARASCLALNEYTGSDMCHNEDPDDNADNCWDLCTAEQWFYSCAYTDLSAAPMLYPYGEAYNADQCNGAEYDAIDGPVLTGTAQADASNQCVADWDSDGDYDVWDLSGNVEEWTLESRDADGTPLRVIRGGSYKTVESGLTCDFDFLASAEENIWMDQVGFRCCKGYNPLSVCEHAIDKIDHHPFGFDVVGDPDRCAMHDWRFALSRYDDWELGKATTVTGSTSCLMGTMLNEDFSRNQASYLASPFMDLSDCNGTTVSLVWDMYFDNDGDNGDRLIVYVSTVGNTDWYRLYDDELEDDNNYDENNTTVGWDEYSLDVSNYFTSDVFQILFYFTSDDDWNRAPGAFVDNIRLEVQ